MRMRPFMVHFNAKRADVTRYVGLRQMDAGMALRWWSGNGRSSRLSGHRAHEMQGRVTGQQSPQWCDGKPPACRASTMAKAAVVQGKLFLTGQGKAEASAASTRA